MTYYIPFSKYHGRWNDLGNLDFHPKKAKYYKGGRLTFYSQPFEIPPKVEEADGAQIPQIHLEYFDKIIQMCNDRGIKLVVYFTPIAAKDMEWYTQTEHMMSAVEKLMDEKGIPFVNCQWNENISIDYETDFQDQQHVNYYGQVKVTDYLGSWLKEHYQMEDHRGDIRYHEWQDECEEYMKEANISFKRKQEMFVKGLKELGWADFYIPNATFYLWLPIPPRYKDSVEFTDDLMHKSGIIAVPGKAFGIYGDRFFRVSIVCKDSEIEEVFRRMKEDGFNF